MKNKDKYDLTKIIIRPKYEVCGCGKKITESFTFDVIVEGEVVAKDVEAKQKAFKYLMAWLEKDC